MDENETFQMDVKAIKGTVSADGPVSTLFVFGALPRVTLPADHLFKSTIWRAVAHRNATAVMSKHFAKQ